MSTEPQRIKTISEFHTLAGLPRPEHPLISVVNLEDVKLLPGTMHASRVLDFYTISLKRNCTNDFKYGQQHYDVQGGVMYFIAPGQVFTPPGRTDEDAILSLSGYALYVHPDFLWNTPLGKTIKQYEYFDYSVNEALLLIEKEEAIVTSTMQNIQTECIANTDKFSQDIIISLIEVLLNYANRFYNRQFLTRRKEHHQLLTRLEDLLTDYFNSADIMDYGFPGVSFVAEKLNISPNYLSSILKVLTGRNTQQHIQDKMIEKAKERLAGTTRSVSEISYELGFDHPQSFSRLFKSKTGLSPLSFRQSFN